MRLKTVTLLAIILFFAPILIYLAVFGRALRQNENHLGIALALPRAILADRAVRVDSRSYLARDQQSFIEEMEARGFEFTDQMGSGYFFEKEGALYVTSGRMYSSYFMVFGEPEKN